MFPDNERIKAGTVLTLTPVVRRLKKEDAKCDCRLYSKLGYITRFYTWGYQIMGNLSLDNKLQSINHIYIYKIIQ